MITRLKYGGDGLPYNYSEFICDSMDDIENLPTSSAGGLTYDVCSVGSKAYIVNDSSTHILNNQDEWVQYTGSDASWSGRISNSGTNSVGKIATATDDISVLLQIRNRVTSLDSTPLTSGAVVDAVGIPTYVSDISQYTSFGLVETGWYIFARVSAKDGILVTAETTVTGTDGNIITVGADHVDIAVKFKVAAESKIVTIDWGSYIDEIVFRASDLAIRNLDYRSTYYIYDLEPFATWTYALTTDATFVAGKKYYTLNNGEYTLATVNAGDAVTAETYYQHSKLTISGMTRNVTYRLDETIDCPMEINLPIISDGESYGAWFDFQLRHGGSYSVTLTPQEGVKIATNDTPNPTKGINYLHLHYAYIDGEKVWSAMNTHTDFTEG